LGIFFLDEIRDREQRGEINQSYFHYDQRINHFCFSRFSPRSPKSKKVPALATRRNNKQNKKGKTCRLPLPEKATPKEKERQTKRKT